MSSPRWVWASKTSAPGGSSARSSASKAAKSSCARSSGSLTLLNLPVRGGSTHRIRAVTDVLIYADSIRSPEMRHEVPLPVPDPFLYVEGNGERHVVVSSFEVDRVKEVAPDLDTIPPEELGLDELYAQGLPRDEIELELVLRAVQRFGVTNAAVPKTFPLEIADHLRANGIELKADRELFVSRRRVKNEAE